MDAFYCTFSGTVHHGTFQYWRRTIRTSARLCHASDDLLWYVPSRIQPLIAPIEARVYKGLQCLENSSKLGYRQSHRVSSAILSRGGRCGGIIDVKFFASPQPIIIYRSPASPEPLAHPPAWRIRDYFFGRYSTGTHSHSSPERQVKVSLGRPSESIDR